MVIYRIVDSKYKDDLSGEGAKMFGGRWNPKGKSVIYCSAHISLSMLENMVYMSQDLIRINYHLLHISIPDDEVMEIDHEALKPKWIQDMEYTRWVGEQFLNQNGFALKVPSAIVGEEFNFMLNAEHSLFQKVKIIKQRPFIFDDRLF